MNARKFLRPVFVLASIAPALAVLAAPSVEIRETTATATTPRHISAALHYREARADKRSPTGDDVNVKNIKQICSLLGVSTQFHGSAPLLCGVRKVERMPEAVICATPPPGNTSQTDDSKSRKCEFCVGLPSEVKCDETLKVEASIEADFSFPVYGINIACKGKVKYDAEAKAKIEVQNTKWNSVDKGTGTDEAVTYVSSLTKSTVSSAASIALGAGCTFDGKVITAEMSADLALNCEFRSTVALGSIDSRDKKTCGDTPDASVEKADAADVVTDSDAAPADAGAADSAKPDAAPVVQPPKSSVPVPAM